MEKISPNSVSIRMYCLGTGDCFVLKFYDRSLQPFTVMIDCGSCRGDKADFEPYLRNLAGHVDNKLDLLIVTHEHNDHVNGFEKWPEIFDAFEIREAWFAWTENPKDPGGRTYELMEKRKKMRKALHRAITEIKKRRSSLENGLEDNYYKQQLMAANTAYVGGLDTLAGINLNPVSTGGKSLPGMTRIREILKRKKTRMRYLNPGETVTIQALPGFMFHVLGPPNDKDNMFKDGKEGRDVYRRNFALNESSLAANAFISLLNGTVNEEDRPFTIDFVAWQDCTDEGGAESTNAGAADVGEGGAALGESGVSVWDDSGDLIDGLVLEEEDNAQAEGVAAVGAGGANLAGGSGAAGAGVAPVGKGSAEMIERYKEETWRRIDDDWLNSAGALALRLNSHINNTSLALAVESEASGKVLLLPGDAEYGSWESWHLIKKWNKKGRNEKHLTEDLLNRTVFYKVSHHLSFNGTALEKGINMMSCEDLVAMATLDRTRISEKWKNTMPNKYLIEELKRRTQGRFFIMSEAEIDSPPSQSMNPQSPGAEDYHSECMEDGTVICKQYTIKF